MMRSPSLAITTPQPTPQYQQVDFVSFIVCSGMSCIADLQQCACHVLPLACLLHSLRAWEPLRIDDNAGTGGGRVARAHPDTSRGTRARRPRSRRGATPAERAA